MPIAEIESNGSTALSRPCSSWHRRCVKRHRCGFRGSTRRQGATAWRPVSRWPMSMPSACASMLTIRRSRRWAGCRGTAWRTRWPTRCCRRGRGPEGRASAAGSIAAAAFGVVDLCRRAAGGGPTPLERGGPLVARALGPCRDLDVSWAACCRPCWRPAEDKAGLQLLQRIAVERRALGAKRHARGAGHAAGGRFLPGPCLLDPACRVARGRAGTAAGAAAADRRACRRHPAAAPPSCARAASGSPASMPRRGTRCAFMPRSCATGWSSSPA